MSVRMRHVSIMQYVSILRGTTAVSASQDSPEMDTTVKVCVSFKNHTVYSNV